MENREQWIIEDITHYLNKARLADYDRRKFIFRKIDALFWDWTMRYGNHKYKAQQFYTEDALDLFKSLENDELSKNLVHEHVVPKKVMLDMLDSIISKRAMTSEDVEKFLRKYCISCVVTGSEDKILTKSGYRQIMPKAWDKEDIWGRYKVTDLFNIIEIPLAEVVKNAEKEKRLSSTLVRAMDVLNELNLPFEREGKELFVEKDGEIISVYAEPRFMIVKELLNQGIWTIFPANDEWYLVPCDKEIEIVESATNGPLESVSWVERGAYSWNGLTKKLKKALISYKIK